MFTVSFYLLHCVLNFVLKSAHNFIYRRHRGFRRNADFQNYDVARCSSFEATCTLVDDNISFTPPVFIQRYLVACDIIKNQVAHSSKLLKVVDFGCAEVSLFEYLKRIDGLSKVLCIDIDEDLLERYHPKAKPLTYNHICPRKMPFSVDILAGSVADCDPCLLETDIVVGIELIEHLYPPELNAIPWTVFGFIQPQIVVFTTPNVEFNVMFKDLKGFRHYDHKFEWTRREFHDWAENIVLRYPNYEVHFSGIGPGPTGTENLGCVSQMAVFIRKGAVSEEAASSVIEENKYKLIASYEYPFAVDSRTDAEKIRDEVTHHRIRIGYLEPYVDQDPIKIELSNFMPFVNEWCHSVEELKTVLESFGSVIERNENGDLCVIGMEDERSDEEEGYLTGDLETENAFSDWGTYRAACDRSISPAWDVAEIPEDKWDTWDIDDSDVCVLENYPRPSSVTEVTPISTHQAFLVSEVSSQGADNREIRTRSVLTEKNTRAEETSNNSLSKEQLEKSRNNKTKNPIVLIDLTENDEAVITSDLTKSNETVLPVSNENYENVIPTEGVWVISEELKCSKPHRRKYNKNKKKKSLDTDQREETCRKSLDSKRIKNKNRSRKVGNTRDTDSKNAGITGVDKLSDLTSCNINENPLVPKKSPVKILINNAPLESNCDLESEPSKLVKSEIDETALYLNKVPLNSKVLAADGCNNKLAETKNESMTNLSKTDTKLMLTNKSEKDPSMVFNDSVNNRLPKLKARRARKKRLTRGSSETTNISDEKSQISLNSSNNRTLNNSNRMTGNINSNSKSESQINFSCSKPVACLNQFASDRANSSSQNSRKMKNNTHLLPKILNQDNADNIADEKVIYKRGNPFMSCILKVCEEPKSLPCEISHDDSFTKSK